MTVEAAATSSGASNPVSSHAFGAPGNAVHSAADAASLDTQRNAGHVADPASRITFGWFLKRAIIGIAILVVSIGGMAWLTHASIDPSQELDEANETILQSIARAADKLL